MRKILLVLTFMTFGICYAFDSTQAQFPQAQFQSVSTYRQVTNYQPNITPVGATTVSGPSYSPRPRRNNVGPEQGNDPGDPNHTPIGDCPVELLVVFGIIYFAMVKIHYNKCKLVESTSTNG